MKSRLIMFFVVGTLIIFTMSSVLAAGSDEESPLWFRLLEPCGVAIGLIALIISYYNYRIVGGIVGRSYTYVMGMLLAFILAFIVRILIENRILPNKLLVEAIFELLLYAGVILIVISSITAARGFKQMQKESKRK